jgi:predicted enzyme related to lactoylglutathione lyase
MDADMDTDEPEPGTPSWIDLQSAVPDAAAKFYAALFGWTLDDAHEEADGSGTLLLHGRPAAGIGPLREPDRPGWTMFVTVADVDEAAERVTAAGGMILTPPTGAAKAERRAVFADPAGVRFAVRQTGKGEHAAPRRRANRRVLLG